MKTCENCGNDHAGEYGSGRFCSLKCARGFATKNKRKEINEKVKNVFADKRKIKNEKCKNCGTNFFKKRKNREFCSNSCARKYAWTDIEYRKNLQEKIALRSLNSTSFGAKSSIFMFNSNEILCQSNRERKALELILEKYLVSSIFRCNFCISYEFNGKSHKYNPDFDILLDDGTRFIIEVKTQISNKETNKLSRPHYFLTINSKKEALIKYCNENNSKAIWIDNRFTILN